MFKEKYNPFVHDTHVVFFTNGLLGSLPVLSIEVSLFDKWTLYTLPWVTKALRILFDSLPSCSISYKILKL